MTTQVAEALREHRGMMIIAIILLVMSLFRPVFLPILDIFHIETFEESQTPAPSYEMQMPSPAP